MVAFRGLLVLFVVVVGVYTGVVVAQHGWILFSVFFGDIAAMTWAGQFNTDFMCFLALSGLWLAWRHHFTPGGLVLGVLGFVGGIMVLAPYLLVTSFRCNGDARTLLLGTRRAQS